jgi:hypothetical protein
MIDLAADARVEAIRIALAAAEVSWLAPAFLTLSRVSDHSLFLVWLGLLVIYLAYSTIYRALVEAHLPLWLQQALLVATLLLSIALVLRFHVNANTGLRGFQWLYEPFRHFADEKAGFPASWSAILVLVYLWARGVHLARRSVSIDRVGFSFRLGVLIFMGVALLANGFLDLDVSGAIVAYFFFALLAIGLARVEEVRQAPNSVHVGFSGFWIGSTVGAVAVLMLLAGVVAIFFRAGGLRHVLHWLSPVLIFFQIAVAAVGMLLVALLQLILSLFSIDLGSLGAGLRRALNNLGRIADLGRLMPPPAESAGRPPFLTILQAVVTTAIPIIVVLAVLIFTWHRVRQARRGARAETHESLTRTGTLRDGLRAALRASRERLGELAGLVDPFGLGTRFLSAMSIRRIYANLTRLAAEAGYPRATTQTPYEYLHNLHRALPGSDADVGAITEAYVNAHYGRVPDSPEELQEIRDCWERVRARQAERLRASK